MKILHIVENYSLTAGGVRTVVKSLIEELNSFNYTSFVLTSLKEKEDNNVFVVNSNNIPWLYSKKWKKKIKEIYSEKNVDCVHIHGTWMYPQLIAAKFCCQNQIPFILTPHGMYEPWLWKKGTLKKKLYFNFLVKKYFNNATIIHAITKNEEKNLKKILQKPRVIEIPNLIKVKEHKNHFNKNNIKYILYIGRLDKVKGIDLLIKAFVKINRKDVKLKIAGDFNSYKKELEKLIKLSKINNIEFLGFVKGKAKIDLIKNAIVLVAPSFSEVIGMVNLEAAILKTPVITTFQTGLNKSWNENGGYLINPNEEELIKSLSLALNWSNEERDKNGQKLYDFVIQNYTWQNRINDWENLYKSIL